jgi:hypothetical protein
VREDPETVGLANLSIVNCLPFAEGILVLILRRHEIETLKLYQIHLESEEACWDLAAAELHNLELASCDFADGGCSTGGIHQGRTWLERISFFLFA